MEKNKAMPSQEEYTLEKQVKRLKCFVYLLAGIVLSSPIKDVIDLLFR